MWCPPGSILGPILFTIYTLSLGGITCGHHSDDHLYEDDSELYLACDPSTTSPSISNTKICLEACITDIRQWMPLNSLKLNDDKTECLSIHSKNLSYPFQPHITISTDTIFPSWTAKNLRVIFDANLTLKPHVSSICKSAFFQLC